jgi:hypothetical protein
MGLSNCSFAKDGKILMNYDMAGLTWLQMEEKFLFALEVHQMWQIHEVSIGFYLTKW